MRRFLLATVMGFAFPTLAQSEEIVVFAAASLKPALDAAVTEWSAQTGDTALISYGSSSTLAKQIEQGAPVDVFLSAAQDWMDKLDSQGLIVAGSHVDLWGNSLSLIAADPHAVPFALDRSTDLASIIGDGRLAMGLVASVPVGQYGKEALESLGLWNSVEPVIIQAQDATATVALVSSGEVAYGIVYETDAMAAEAIGKVVEVSQFPTNTHSPIVYPGGLVVGSTKPSGAEFLKFMQSQPVSAIFAAKGFTVLAQ